MGPPPMTTAFSPATSSERRTSCTATATGSTRAAASSAISAGSATSVLAGTFQSACRAPGESMPMKSRFWQMWELPARQAGQVPSQASGMTVTASPTLHPSTPSPIAAIVPLISWPNTRGFSTRASMLPCRMCRSVPHSPTYATRSCTSPGRGGAGSASAIVMVESPEYAAVSIDPPGRDVENGVHSRNSDDLSSRCLSIIAAKWKSGIQSSNL